MTSSTPNRPSATLSLSDRQRARARSVQLLALDVDGVLSDGRLYYDANGVEAKAFHTQDGVGIKMLLALGIEVAIITGRTSPMVERRVEELGIKHLIMGRDDKWQALSALASDLALGPEHLAYCGDDLPDLEAIMKSGLGVSVPNAPTYIQENADVVTQRAGGYGAVRELCELIVDAKGQWPQTMRRYLATDDTPKE
ncbi:KdsC family phosphatase [Larsenimonas salina]|uniref:KdsC family phosphatase n=1 Tax=Larsenimonas salina TaxID=1295565 RepID=UPI0020735264|nr:HAD hydrolase family protein [Larsenimonas salina]MCM5703113.1 HAD hydrolase family protein [Larsenimonas salina]